MPKLLATGVVEVAPLAYMRGRTLNDSFIVLDEAQNTSPEQMKMFLTRLGFGSQDGRHRRRDAGRPARPARRGCRWRSRCCSRIDDIHFATLTSADVVRHTLVGAIVDAYTEHDQRQMARSARKPQQHHRGRRR